MIKCNGCGRVFKKNVEHASFGLYIKLCIYCIRGLPHYSFK